MKRLSMYVGVYLSNGYALNAHGNAHRCECVCTVPYEGDNFAKTKMDNFSLIID